MKRLLIAVVLIMLVTAVAASPAFAYLSAQAGGPVVSASPAGAPVTASHAAAPPPTGALPAWSPGAAAPSRRPGSSVAACRAAPYPRVTAARAILIALLLAVVIGGAVYAIAADRRRHAPAGSAEPARLPAFKPAADQKRKAA